jgi:hypothetical protein
MIFSTKERPMPLLAKLGVCELTVAALSGWAMVATIEKPTVLERLGVRHLGRIRQAHLDLLMMGTILTAVGIAVNPLPAWIGVLLAVGACVVPTMFALLAFDASLQRASTAYRAVNTVVLVGFSVGWVALAAVVVTR